MQLKIYEVGEPSEFIFEARGGGEGMILIASDKRFPGPGVIYIVRVW